MDKRRAYDCCQELRACNVSGGGLNPYSAAIWIVLLQVQFDANIRGNFLEVGVWHGLGAAMMALQRRPAERLVLVDKYAPKDHFLPVLREADAEIENDLDFHQTDSNLAARRDLLRDYKGEVRWSHIDGEHSCEAALGDMELALTCLADRGVIAVDDFFAWECPQVSQAVFDFIDRRKAHVSMLCCGFGKACICAPKDLPLYQQAVLSLPDALDE